VIIEVAPYAAVVAAGCTNPSFYFWFLQ